MGLLIDILVIIVFSLIFFGVYKYVVKTIRKY
ncbi:hypothetical protein BACCIP111883_01420 [Sutcliffiella rhizosphaerae]|uniref:Uncharacterized protein n=1 Tax=Sutcliffiella rhizosphaerae TaxID=2880967 RepID=A0ABN8A8C2_9BACI|nr:hypothetical protein BACCIP111883_01420 [Sutcliffiella rhizosphaerae]